MIRIFLFTVFINPYILFLHAFTNISIEAKIVKQKKMDKAIFL